MKKVGDVEDRLKLEDRDLKLRIRSNIQGLKDLKLVPIIHACHLLNRLKSLLDMV